MEEEEVEWPESGLKRINKRKNYMKCSTEMWTVQNLTRVFFLDSTKLIPRIKILFRKLQMLQLVKKLPSFVPYEGVLPCLQQPVNWLDEL